MADLLNANDQFKATQIETIVYGVLSALFALIGLFFAYLQLRQMYPTDVPITCTSTRSNSEY
jgi:energy-converting hydrogenase Eha subunit F